jgi:hypothetical protein
VTTTEQHLHGPDGTAISASSATAGSDEQIASDNFRIEPDELDIWYFNHRKLFIGLYICVFLIVVILLSFRLFGLPQLLHIVFHLLLGKPERTEAIWNDFLTDKTPGYFIIAVFAYVLAQLAALWGLGTVYIQRRSHRGRTVIAVAAVAFAGALLPIGAAGLIEAALQTAANSFQSSKLALLDMVFSYFIWIFGAGWLFWFFLGCIHWYGRGRNGTVQRLVRAVLATSWIEFSLALPIDIAARNRESCYCGIGSYMTLVVTLPILVWSFGPALYLFYLRERELSLSDPGRALKILRAKTRVPRQFASRKAESYVSSARTISLALLLLGFVGLNLGLFNYQRSALFADTRDLVLVRALTQKFRTNQMLLNQMTKTGDGSQTLTYSDSSLGEITIISSAVPALRDTQTGVADGSASIVFSATVTRNKETWKTKTFSLDREDNDRRLDRALTALALGSDTSTPYKLIQKIEEAIYSRRVKIPSIDFGDFTTESAVWVVTLLCVAALVAFRSAVHRILRSPDTGIAETWLILDARAVGEKIVAAVWIAGIILSPWFCIFGLILTAMDAFALAPTRPAVIRVLIAYAGFIALIGLSTWAGTGATADIIRLRVHRRILDGS